MTWYDKDGKPDRAEPVDPVEAYVTDLAKAYGVELDMEKSDEMEGTDGMAKMDDPMQVSKTAILELRPDPDASYKDQKAEEDEESMGKLADGAGDPSEDIVNKGVHIDIGSHNADPDATEEEKMEEKSCEKMGLGAGTVDSDPAEVKKSATELLNDLVEGFEKGMPTGEPKKLSSHRCEHDGGDMGMAEGSTAAQAVGASGPHAPKCSACGEELSAKKDDIREDVEGPKDELEEKVGGDEDLQMKKSEEEEKAELIEEIKKAIEARLPKTLDDEICKAMEAHDGVSVYTEINHGLVDSPWKNGDK